MTTNLKSAKALGLTITGTFGGREVDDGGQGRPLQGRGRRFDPYRLTLDAQAAAQKARERESQQPPPQK